MPAPAVINRLPLVSSLLKWFKGDELTIDNALFKLHHQVNLILVTLFLGQSQFKVRDGGTNILSNCAIISRPAPLLWCSGFCSFFWKITWTDVRLSARAETIMQGEQVWSWLESWNEERVDRRGGSAGGGRVSQASQARPGPAINNVSRNVRCRTEGQATLARRLLASYL